MKQRTVISMEQALSMPYATLRFAQLGWRVIRIEAVSSGKGLPGDPNRYIGSEVVDDDRRSYFVAPNVGKQAIALNLKEKKATRLCTRLLKNWTLIFSAATRCPAAMNPWALIMRH